MAEDIELEDGGIEVELPVEGEPDKKAASAEPPKAAETPPTPPQPDNSAAIAELRAQLEAAQSREQAALRERAHLEQLAREQAEAVARAEEDAAKSHTEMVGARKSNIESAISAAKAEADVARRDYQVALEAGDFAKASDANWRSNRAAAQVALLEREAAVVPEPPRQKSAEGAVRQPPQRLTDPVEAYIDNKSPRTQAWLRQHPDTITDPKLNNKTVAAHYDALAEGYAVDTDAYFNFIDRKLGFAGQLADDSAAQAPATPTQAPRKAQPPAAPVSRDAPTSRERNSSRMYLTKGEQEVAEALGITPTEYARRKVAMEKQGYYR